MKKILMLLAFVVVSAMGESDHETKENLSQEERFEMLFGNTTLQFIEVRQARTSRKSRHNRKYEMLCEKTILTKRIARTSRLIFPRQFRRSLYVGLNF